MRLAVNVIHNGRYFREGDDVDEELIPSSLRRVNDNYAAKIQRQREEADANEGEPAPQHPRPRAHAKAQGKPSPGQKYVRRKFGFQRVDGLTLVAGEKVYKREGNAFVRVGRVPKGEKAH
jgi:hypothetical protein